MSFITSASPRKVVPLAGGPLDLQRTKSEGPSHVPTRRAYYCGVVVENEHVDSGLAQDVEQLITSLGDALGNGDKTGMERSTSAPNITDSSNLTDMSNGPRKRALTSTSAYNDVLNELVTTERSYVSKLRMLKQSYADPLRKFARRPEEAILPAYEAKTLFGNIDTILPANEAFLVDLEEMLSGNSAVGGVGDVCLKHLRDLRAFDCYKQYYSKREEAQGIFEREMAKRSSTGFIEFIERTKYSTESKNKIGLRELLVEPIQRIPRYTLMFRTMIKHMAPTDPQRAKLIEADEVASKIAQAETDEQTKRAAVMHCLERSIDGFPPNLFSSGRTFLDCIDVEDDGGVPISADGRVSSGPLHCTLFLFDDRLLIVKRPNGNSTGRSLSGLDEVERALRTGGLPVGLKKGTLSCKGVVEITDLVATDAGAAEFHLFLETQLSDEYSDRWSNRPFRAYSIVHPPAPPNYDPVRTRNDKQRFLECLWNAQAMYRSKDGSCLTRVSEEREMPGRSIVRTWFNVYQRADWEEERKKKHKIILHIDPMGTATPLPFGVNGPPYVIARAQPMAGELCRYTVTSNDPNDEPEEDIVHTAAIPARIAQTIHQFGLFKFRTGRNSLPSTPASTRSRTAMFGLDALSRNLSSSLRNGDVFGIGSISSSHKRTKSSTVSRSSTVTTGTSNLTDSLKFSQRSHSTAGTSISSVGMDDDDVPRRHSAHLDVPTPRKLVKRSRSPGGTSGAESGSEMELERRRSGSVGRRGSQRRRRSDRLSADEDEEMTDASEAIGNRMVTDESEWDLTMRLELARKNSQSQEAGRPTGPRAPAPLSRHGTIDEDISMDVSTSTSSMLAQQGSADISSFPGAGSGSPPQASLRSGPSITPTPSVTQTERPRSIFARGGDRPMGPRSATRSPPGTRPTSPTRPSRPTTPSYLQPEHRPPSRPTTPTTRNVEPSYNHPLPPLPPMPLSRVGSNPTIDDLERVVSPVSNRRLPPEPTPAPTPKPVPPITNSRPPPFKPVSRIPVPVIDDLPEVPNPVGPLQIKKRVERPSSPPSRRSVAAPLDRNSSARRLSVQTRNERQAIADAATDSLGTNSRPTTRPPQSEASSSKVASTSNVGPSRIPTYAQATKTEADACRRVVKRIKLEVQSLRGSTPPALKDPISRIRAPSAGIPRSPQSRHIANKAAEARMEEMRAMIQSRNGRVPTVPAAVEPVRASSPVTMGDDNLRRIEELADEADNHLEQIATTQDQVMAEADMIQERANETAKGLAAAQSEVARARGQCDLVKSLLADATSENEILYQAFNDELDGLFDSINLPDVDAWKALTEDLRRTKESRNKFQEENAALKRNLAQVELVNKEWGTLLRSNGLLPPP